MGQSYVRCPGCSRGKLKLSHCTLHAPVRHIAWPQAQFRGLAFPEPYDATCSRLPPERRGVGLVTKRVLVMELCQGASITKIGQKILADFAASQGLSVEQFKADMKEKASDPEFLEEMLKKGAPTERQVALYRGYLWARDWARNAAVLAYNWTAGWFLGQSQYAWSHIPPNGPSITKFLFDVHGYEIFSEGAFNADPHAGNIILDVSRAGG